jgi:hypothetical protein
MTIDIQNKYYYRRNNPEIELIEYLSKYQYLIYLNLSSTTIYKNKDFFNKLSSSSVKSLILSKCSFEKEKDFESLSKFKNLNIDYLDLSGKNYNIYTLLGNGFWRNRKCMVFFTIFLDQNMIKTLV